MAFAASIAYAFAALGLTSLFWWIYVIKSSRGWAICWLGVSLPCSVGIGITVLRASDFHPVELAGWMLTCPVVVGLVLGRWRWPEHIGQKQVEAKQEYLSRLHDPKDFD